MKVIFLDIDGVLNNAGTRQAKSVENKLRTTMVEQDLFYFDEHLVQNLAQIVAATGAKIVISSSWRWMRTPEMMQELLTLAGAPSYVEVIGDTDKRFSRWTAIGEYLLTHPEIESYVALDDDDQKSEGYHTELMHVLTNDITGLDEACVQKAINILTKYDRYGYLKEFQGERK